MSSALARQLASIASIDSDRISSHHGAPTGKSYLFMPSQAAAMDNNEVYNIASSGFEELLQLDPRIEEFEDELFSEGSKSIDRMMLSADDNKRLSKTLENFLWRVSPWLHLKAAAKCVEWLVRRFRIHELNVEATIRAFLPYQETSQFPRILAILKLTKSSPYYYLLHPHQKSPGPISRQLLVQFFGPNKDPSLALLRDFMSMLHNAAGHDAVYRTLLNFWTSTLVDFLERWKSDGIPDSVVRVVVEGFVEALSVKHGGSDFAPAIYSPLLLLVRTIDLSPSIYSLLLDALAVNEDVHPSHRLIAFAIMIEKAPMDTLSLNERWIYLLSDFGGGEAILPVCEKYRLARVVDRLLPWMCKRVSGCHEMALHLLQSSTRISDNAIVGMVTSMSELSSDAADATGRQAILSALRQRYPDQLSAAISTSATLRRHTKKRKTQIDVMDTSDDLHGIPPSVAAVSADLSTRIYGISSLLRDLDQQDYQTVRSTLEARILDPESQIAATIYQSGKVFDFLSVEEYASVVEMALRSQELSKETMILHVDFVLGSPMSEMSKIRCMVPVMLFVKARRLTVAALWEHLSQLTVNVPKVIQQAIRAYQETISTELEDGLPNLSLVNKRVADALASPALFEVFLSGLNAPDDQLRHLSTLALSSSLSSLSDSDLEKVWQTAIQADGTTLEAAGGFEDKELLRRLYSKPAHVRTSAMSRYALLQSLCQAGMPKASPRAALSTPDLSSTIYQVYNFSLTAPSELSADLQAVVFAATGPDALVALANIWVTAANSQAQSSALRHARAFMAASRNSERKYEEDFQCLLPAILLAMSSDESATREAAAQLVRSWADSVAEAPKSVYRVDDLYGESTRNVKLLLPRDLRSYLEALCKESDAIIADETALKTFHSRFLTAHPADGKKTASMRKALIACLLTHALAWQNVMATQAIINSVSGIADSAALDTISPSIERILDSIIHGHELDEPTRHLGPTLFGFINVNTTRKWARDCPAILDKIITVVGIAARKTRDTEAIRALILQQFSNGVFGQLSISQQVRICLCLSRAMNAVPPESATAAKTFLQGCKLDISVIVGVLDQLAQTLAPGADEGHHKRLRSAAQSSQSVSEPTEAMLALMAFMSSRNAEDISGDITFISSAVNALSAIASRRSSSSASVVDFLEQSLLASMTASLGRIKSLGSHQVGMDVIVKLIRATSNPRTAQQALLFTSVLAQHSPESVLHYVMPIFTFMGSSEIDDAYTFGVVEKTVQSIVPVIIASFREKTSSVLELQVAARPLLAIFTDMAKRIPRHRCQAFFVHLISTLGPAEFLAPLEMSLMQQGKEAQRMIPSLSTSFNTATTWSAVHNTLVEVARLVSGDKSFLNPEQSLSESQRLASAEQLLRMIRANIHSATAKSADVISIQQSIRSIVEILRKVATTIETKTAKPLVKTLTSMLNETLTKLSVQGFMGLVTDLVKASDNGIVEIGLTMLCERLPLVQDQVRLTLSPVLSEVITTVIAQLKMKQRISLGVRTLLVISNVPARDEDGPLSSAVPVLLQVVADDNGNDEILPILRLLTKLTPRLATRMIPFVKSTISVSLKMAQSSDVSKEDASMEVLASVVATLPTFLNADQITKILGATLEQQSKRSRRAQESLLQTMSKKIQTAVILPILVQIWKISKHRDSKYISTFFMMLQRTVRQSDRGALPATVKNAFTMILETLDMGRDTRQDFHNIAIQTFLDLTEKLSESAFKPLFSRFYDWAFVNGSEKEANRAAMFYRALAALISRFKAIMIPYLEIPAQAMLNDLKSEDWNSLRWKQLMAVLRESLQVPENVFWTTDTYKRFIPALTEQVERLSTVPDEHAEVFTQTMAALAASTTSEVILKQLNASMLLVTRSENPRTRLIALSALDEIWARQEELVQFVPETVGEFLNELLEDEDGSVEQMARKFLKRIEGYVGDLSAYLE